MAVWNYLTEVLADTPYLLWRCHESSGPTAADASGNGRDGTYFGTDITFGEDGIHSDESATIVRFNPSGSIYDAGISYSPVAAGFPSTDLTLEWVLRDATFGSTRTLWSYCDSGGVEPDTLRVVWSNFSSQVLFYVDGASVTFNVPNGWSKSSLGLQHFAITWRSSDGRAQFFINGQLMDTETVGLGFSIPAGGGLVIAQDQDSLLGGYVTTDALSCTAGEFAVYDTVLPDARLRVHASAAMTRYIVTDEIPLTLGSLGDDVAPFDIRADTTVFTNRVWDTVAGGFVRWTGNAPDPTGLSYPGPGTFGVHTSDYCIESVA